MLKKLYYFFVITLFYISLNSQTFQHINHYTNSSYQSAEAIGSDKSGNTYVAGHFMGTLTLGATTLTSTGGTDYYVAKYDSTNTLLWAISNGGTGDEKIKDLVVLESGVFFLIGTYTGQTKRK